MNFRLYSCSSLSLVNFDILCLVSLVCYCLRVHKTCVSVCLNGLTVGPAIGGGEDGGGPRGEGGGGGRPSRGPLPPAGC